MTGMTADELMQEYKAEMVEALNYRADEYRRILRMCSSDSARYDEIFNRLDKINMLLHLINT